MSDRNWEAELAKIDKQLASVSDEQLLAEKSAPAVGAAPGGKLTAGKSSASAAAAPVARSSSPAAGKPWVAWLKVGIAVGAAAGLMFWPWPARCGLPLVGFTAATGAVSVLGIWSAIGTWRHRLGLAHVASLLVTLWGAALGAREILPRVGYAIPSIERAAQWSCEGLPELAPPVAPDALPPGATPPATSPPALQPG